MVVDLWARDLEGMGIDVPELSRDRIVSAADGILRDYAMMLDQPVTAPVDVLDIVGSLLELSWGFSDLQRDYGDGVHGTIWFSRREIWIDRSLDPDRFPEMRWRMHFTIAHEVGHWVLHRRLFIDEHGKPMVFGDDIRPDVICRSHGGRPLVERQADAFAGSLLMPEWLLRPVWKEHTGVDSPLTDEDVFTRVGHVDPARFSFVDGAMNEPPDPVRVRREMFCDPLAQRFAVSPEAMRIELETLGLFVD